MAEHRKNNYTCSRCGNHVDTEKALIIDDLPVCVECIYGKSKPFEIYPIGVVKNNLSRSKVGFGTEGKQGVSRIELFESQKPFLYKLEEEKSITVVYYLHQTNAVRSVFNRGLDGKKVGVFASRTPYRLSKIGIQDVRLLKVEGATLFVKELDAVNGTPVLDIKMRWNALNNL
ncbi:MAG: SAM-dependent methyltransferase [Candidatus Omnitrophica bacterium]|nr:SAM-dependent methyltransferase [Candidatus Omnitrophota bacterium]